MPAIVNAINSNPCTTGQRVAAKIVQEGTSVLGTPFDYVRDRDARQHRQPQLRAQRPGILARRDRRNHLAGRRLWPRSTRGPAFAWITGAPHGNEPAGGEATEKELYELAARTDCDNEQRLHNLDMFIQPVTAPDDRDHNNRTTAWDFDPNRDRGTIQIPPRTGPDRRDHQVPRPVLHRRAPADERLLLPARPGRGAERDLALRAGRDPERDRAGDPEGFNDQTDQYRNYNTYDLFVPEYGDTVPSLLMGGAGMTYEKGNTENYGKQVYDHYLAMDTTINVVAENKCEPDDQLDQAVAARRSPRARAAASRPTRRSARRPWTCTRSGSSTIDQNPNTNVCGYYYLPDGHAGDVAQTIKDLQFVGVSVDRLNSPVTVPGVARVRQLQHQRRPRAGRRRTRPRPDAAGRDAVHPARPGQQALDPGGARREPLPAVQLLLRRGDVVVLAAARIRRGRLPHPAAAGAAAEMARIGDPALGTAPATAQPVYAFNTDSTAGLAMVNQLLGQGATVARGGGGFDAGGVHFDSGAALVSGSSVTLRTLTADAAQWETPVYGLPGYPVRALRDGRAEDRGLHRRDDGADQPRLPRQRGRLLHHLDLLRGDVRPDPEGRIPTSQISQLTSTDLANGVLQSGGYTVLIDPGSTISATTPTGTAGTPAAAVQAFINAGGDIPRHQQRGRDQRPQRRCHRLNTNTISRHQHARVHVRRDVEHLGPGGLGLRRGRLDLPRVEQRSGLRPGHPRR